MDFASAVASTLITNPTAAPMAEITRALNELVDRPACIGGPSFETFPLTLGTSLRDPRPRTDEQAKFDALAEVGLLSKAGEHSYELTDAGSAVHTDEGQFCFAQGFEIGQITSTEPIPAGRLAPGVEGGWIVSFTIVPTNLEEWIFESAIAEAAPTFGAIEQHRNPISKTVPVAMRDGQIQLETFAFSFRPGVSW